jgi:hypothetical protein
MDLPGIGGSEQLGRSHRNRVEEALESEEKIRERRWSESIAVGSLSLVERVKTVPDARGLAGRSPRAWLAMN